MGLFNAILELLSDSDESDSDETDSPDPDSPECKGERFENFVIDKFSNDYFDIIERTHSWNTNKKRFVESSLNPDFTLRYRPTKEEFAIECKYRSGLTQEGMLEYCKPDQFIRYKNFMYNKKIPVYIIVGFNGDDDDPDEIFVLPLKEMKYPTLYPSIFKKYSKNPEKNFHWKNGKLS
jgi:hypothetical protein